MFLLAAPLYCRRRPCRQRASKKGREGEGRGRRRKEEEEEEENEEEEEEERDEEGGAGGRGAGGNEEEEDRESLREALLRRSRTMTTLYELDMYLGSCGLLWTTR